MRTPLSLADQFCLSSFSMRSLQTWLSLLLPIVLSRILHSVCKTHRLRKLMPPGPLGLPLLGNVLQFREEQWVKFTKWKERYGSYASPIFYFTATDNCVGPIFSLNLAGQPAIVINDFTTASDLLGKYLGTIICVTDCKPRDRSSLKHLQR